MKQSQIIFSEWVGAWVLALMLAAAGCRPAPVPPPSRPVVAATFFPLYDFARYLAGTNAEVVCLTPAGAQPHGIELTPSMVKRANGARLVLLLGLGLDDWAEKVAGSEPLTRLARVGDGLGGHKDRTGALARHAGEGGGHTHGETDPHVWMDPVLAQELVRRIAAELVALLPESRESIQTNREALLEDLGRLQDEYAAAAQKFAQRRVVTFHGAFGYLFARCGLDVAGCVEPFPGKEPSVAYLRELVDLMRELKQRVIFAEPQLPDNAARTIAAEIGGSVERLDPCETILEHAPDRGYLARQRDNLSVLIRVLGKREAD